MRNFDVLIGLLLILLYPFNIALMFKKPYQFTISPVRKNDIYQRTSIYTTNSEHDYISSPQNQRQLQDIRDKLKENKYSEAYQILKRNPLIHINLNDSRLFLNNIEELVPFDIASDQRQKQITDASTFLYKRLTRQNTLRGYGCIDGEYPEKDTDITPKKLEDLTGLNIAALTPKERSTYWRLSGVLFCLVESVIAQSYGIDPIYSVIPLTLLIITSDQLFLKGAIAETIYQTLVPEYKKKVICHEAGHFLLSYLLGVPIRGCVTNAWEARKYPEIKGQAGTIFYDTKLADEIANQKVTRSSLDRLSVIIMAGIAAEALKFNKAEGGTVDERSLIEFLSSISPPWNILRIQSQARWAATQAILIIKEHRKAYDALVEALEQNKGVGDCIIAIEANLPANLPSLERIKLNKSKEKTRQANMLMRYIQRMTWRVGGIMSSNENLVTVDGYIVNNTTDDKILQSNEKTDVTSINSSDIAVQQFIDRIRKLENAVKKNELVVPDDNQGGLWLNNLSSYNNTNTINHNNTINSNENNEEPIILIDISEEGTEKIVISPPVPNYQEKIIELQLNGSLPIVIDNEEEITTELENKYKVDSLLKNHRGYMMKHYENIKNELKNKAISIDTRLKSINEELLVSPGKKNI